VKIVNINKIDRFLIQNSKNDFKQNSVNQNDKSIGFVDLLISFLTHQSVLSSKMIYRLVFYLSIDFIDLLIFNFSQIFQFLKKF
jgi:hypothetical protein